jgi:penicillin amidase
VDIAYTRQMQFDQEAVPARLIAKYVDQLEIADPEISPVVAMMRQWDGKLTADSSAASVYEVLVRRVLEIALSDKLGDLCLRYAGRGPTPLLAEVSMFGGRASTWLRKALSEPHSHWFDLGNGETRDDVIRLALRETVDFLTNELGPDIRDWAWGRLHTLTYSHILARVKPLDRLFNRGPYPLGGDGTTVWATGGHLHDLSSEVIVGPPFRFIADLGDLRNSLGLLAPGQSGQPGSRHYDDQIQAWFTGEYHPMVYARQDVERETEARLRLLPR